MLFINVRHASQRQKILRLLFWRKLVRTSSTEIFFIAEFLILLRFRSFAGWNILSGHDYFLRNPSKLVMCYHWHIFFGSQKPIVTTSLNRISMKLDSRVELRNYLQSLVWGGYFYVPGDGRISREKLCNFEIAEELRIIITDLLYFRDKARDIQTTLFRTNRTQYHRHLLVSSRSKATY
jgi:hypothetical protein